MAPRRVMCHTVQAMADSARFEIHIGAQGRVVIPAGIRQDLDLRPGDVLLAWAEDGRIILERPQQVLKRLRKRFAGLPHDTSLSRELIADRKEEARREVDL